MGQVLHKNDENELKRIQALAPLHPICDEMARRWHETLKNSANQVAFAVNDGLGARVPNARPQNDLAEAFLLMTAMPVIPSAAIVRALPASINVLPDVTKAGSQVGV